jgi:hypothetical protein
MRTFSTPQKSNSKQVLLIGGPRGIGKTSFMCKLYKNYGAMRNSSSSTKPTVINAELGDSRHRKQQQQSIEPFYLFYFLNQNDHLISVLFDITCKMRAKYLKKGETYILSLGCKRRLITLTKHL